MTKIYKKNLSLLLIRTEVLSTKYLKMLSNLNIIKENLFDESGNLNNESKKNGYQHNTVDFIKCCVLVNIHFYYYTD